MSYLTTSLWHKRLIKNGVIMNSIIQSECSCRSGKYPKQNREMNDAMARYLLVWNYSAADDAAELQYIQNEAQVEVYMAVEFRCYFNDTNSRGCSW